MANETLRVYDGSRYLDLIANPILMNNRETGHYKDVDKIYLTINGVLDDELIKNEIIDFINNLHQTCKSNYYILESWDHYPNLQVDMNYLFSSFALTPEHPSIGEAVVKHIQNLEWIVESYEILKFEHNGQELEIISFFYTKKDNRKNTAFLFPTNAITFNI